MRWISLALLCLGLATGCTQTGGRPPWLDEAMKDAHGDHMRMQGETASPWDVSSGGRASN